MFTLNGTTIIISLIQAYWLEQNPVTREWKVVFSMAGGRDNVIVVPIDNVRYCSPTMKAVEAAMGIEYGEPFDCGELIGENA